MEQSLHRSRQDLRSLDDVSKALGRCTIQQVRVASDTALEALGVHRNPGSILHARINRRQFFELFAEQGEGAQHLLGLPLSVFPVLDISRQGSIFAIHLLLALGLTAEGPLRRKLEYCFHLFDVDDSGELDLSEMTDFLRVAVFVLHALGVLPDNLSDSQLHYLAQDMFSKADSDKGGTVDHAEFGDWLQKSMHTTVVMESIGRAAQLEKRDRILSKKKKRLAWDKKPKKKRTCRSGILGHSAASLGASSYTSGALRESSSAHVSHGTAAAGIRRSVRPDGGLRSGGQPDSFDSSEDSDSSGNSS